MIRPQTRTNFLPNTVLLDHNNLIDYRSNPLESRCWWPLANSLWMRVNTLCTTTRRASWGGGLVLLNLPVVSICVNYGGQRYPAESIPIAVSECNLGIDVILLSSDGVQFGSHTKNISTFAGAFPACDTEDSSVISLTESSDVVSLLLQYMHQQRQPDSSKFEFDILSRLADAVEKYKVFSAMEVCNIHMK
jgi:hypothetical protein